MKTAQKIKTIPALLLLLALPMTMLPHAMAAIGVGDIVFSFGQNGDIPLAGDWDGKPSLP